ncbi:MAG: glycosyltransferase [Planctomycetota bacterium]
MMLSTDLRRGGLPNRLVRLAIHLRGAGVEPIVGCLAERGPLCDELESAGIETFACGARGPFDVSVLLALARHVRRFNPDLIHSSLFHANLAARLVGRLDRPRPLVTSTVTIEIERRWHRVLESLTCGGSDLHVANSAAVAVHLCEDLCFPPDRVVVIPNGISLREIDAVPPVERADHGIEDDVPLVVWAGRMDPVKNLTFLVDVIDRIHLHRSVKVVLLGDGPERARMEKRIADRCLGSVITMSGWSDNVIGWLKAADVLVFPSLTEGSPNVVIEAMSCRCAVVAADIPACRGLIDDGVTGLLCDPREPEEWVNAVMRILDTRDSVSAVVSAARQWVVTHHDLQDVVYLWRELYESLTSGTGVVAFR